MLRSCPDFCVEFFPFRENRVPQGTPTIPKGYLVIQARAQARARVKR
jgi:hypothetical protein